MTISKDDAPPRGEPLTIEDALLHWQLIRDKALKFLLATPTSEAKGTAAWCRVATDASAEIDRLQDRAESKQGGEAAVFEFANPVGRDAD